MAKNRLDFLFISAAGDFLASIVLSFKVRNMINDSFFFLFVESLTKYTQYKTKKLVNVALKKAQLNWAF